MASVCSRATSAPLDTLGLCGRGGACHAGALAQHAWSEWITLNMIEHLAVVMADTGGGTHLELLAMTSVAGFDDTTQV